MNMLLMARRHTTSCRLGLGHWNSPLFNLLPPPRHMLLWPPDSHFPKAKLHQVARRPCSPVGMSLKCTGGFYPACVFTSWLHYFRDLHCTCGSLICMSWHGTSPWRPGSCATAALCQRGLRVLSARYIFAQRLCYRLECVKSVITALSFSSLLIDINFPLN